MVTVAANSAEGISALLYEHDDQLIGYGLQKLMMLVDHYWAEIASHMSHLEALYENESFKYREMAALVLSKLFYHLSEYQDALNYALLAGDYFDVNDRSEFVETMLARMLDSYMTSRKELVDKQKGKDVVQNRQIEQIIERMLSRCLNEKEYRQAAGIAMECRRDDLVVKALQMSGDRLESAYYILAVLPTMVPVGTFYHDIMKALIDIFKMERDYIAVARCYAINGDGESVGDLLLSLMKQKEGDVVTSYNVAFDFLENGSEIVIEQAWKTIQERTGYPISLYNETESSPNQEQTSTAGEKSESEKEATMLSDQNQSDFNSYLEQYRNILSGRLSTKLYSEFLYRADHTDATIIRNMKTWVEMRGSVHQVFLIFANAIMRFGTFNLQFLKENVELLRRQTQWGRFNAVATAGLIFRGHHKHAMSLLQPHLNARHQESSGHSEGGAYFALGLIHAHHGYKIKEELMSSLKTANNENLQHGAALGLAVAAFSTGDEEVYEALKTVLYMDNAVSGEAAGYAMGLVMYGRNNDVFFTEMLEYARETQHEKIIRGLAMGLAFMMYGKQQLAQSRIEELCADKDALIRYGGMYMCGLAYAGTNNNEAIRRLLHCAVSDASHDVRRAAVTCIGLVMFHEPKQCPKVVHLLSESFNPHVRYGAAMALGVACCGSGLQEATEILQVLAIDSIDFVRQGAFIALGMVLMQHNEASYPDITSLRKTYDKVISERNEDPMAKIGAILGQGLMDAGGRNCAITLRSKSGYSNKMGVAGIAMFLQYWYWHPLLSFIGMSLEPTGLIALNPKLVMPKLQFAVAPNLRPGLMAYPAPISAPAAPTPQKVATAVLSTAAKTRLRAKKEKQSLQDSASVPMTDVTGAKEKGEGDVGGRGTTSLSKSSKSEHAASLPAEAEKTAANEKAAAAAASSSSSNVKKETTPAKHVTAATAEDRRGADYSSGAGDKEVLENPTRMLPRYVRSVHLLSERYEKDPLIDLFGIVVLRDKRPQEEETVVPFMISSVVQTSASTAAGSSTTSSTTPGAAEQEPAPPEPFELPEEFATRAI